MSAPAPPLAPDLESGLRRLRLARIRACAPEVLQTATTQRWKPEEVLRTLVEAEIAARDEANLRMREKQAGFPMLRTLEASAWPSPPCRRPPSATLPALSGCGPRRTFSLWDRPAPARAISSSLSGTRRSWPAIACATGGVDLIETLYRGLADNSVGRVIEQLMRCDYLILDRTRLCSPDDMGTQLLFRFVSAAYERRSLGIGSHWPFQDWQVHPRTHDSDQHARPVAASCRGRGHRRGVVQGSAKRTRGGIARKNYRQDKGGDFSWP